VIWSKIKTYFIELFREIAMPKQTVIDRETLIPIGVAMAICMAVFTGYVMVFSELKKLDVQAAEINHLSKDYSYHKKMSEKYFMAIKTSLSRIEGKLETAK
jgi:hypothetical protein